MIILIMVDNLISISSLLSYPIMISSFNKIGSDASVCRAKHSPRDVRLVRKSLIEVPVEAFPECAELCPKIRWNFCSLFFSPGGLFVGFQPKYTHRVLIY